jgi:pimeloyl-ACP methyl ester carboxylesterase
MSPDADFRDLFPFPSRQIAIADGEQRFRLNYVDEGGEHRAAMPLLCVHGNPTWSFYWRNIIGAFRGERRIVAVDHLGCGRSEKPQDFDYCLERHIDNLCKLIDVLDLREITLLVHDWGGAIGLGAAVRCPERFSRLAIFNTGAFPPPFVPLRILACRTPILGRIAVRGFNVFARAALSMATAKPQRMTPAVRAGLLAPYDSWGYRVGIWRFIRDIPLSKRHRTWKTLESIEAALPSLADRPIKLIWGMRDWCFNDVCLRKFQAIFPNAQTHAFDDAGHYVVEDAHERIVPLMRELLGQ